VKELELINWFTSFLPKEDENIRTANEDAFCLKWKDEFLLFTTDAMIEGVHFSFDYFKGFEVGWKLAAVNLSDIAACGGEPLFALLNLGIPQGVQFELVEEFFKGLISCLSNWNVKLAGGDTVSSCKWTLSLFLMGKTKKPIFRKGAMPGDVIVVSKYLGESSAFLRKVKKKTG